METMKTTITAKIKILLYIALGSIITLTIGALVYGGAVFMRSLRPDNLTFTYIQPIKQKPPVFHLDEAVQVEALFYNSNNQPLSFTALVFWTHNDKQILQFSFLRTIQPGCTEMNFENHAPDEVAQITHQLFAEGQKEVQWRIEGHNAVTSPYKGGFQPFQVQEAIYIPDSQPLPNRKTEDRLKC